MMTAFFEPGVSDGWIPLFLILAGALSGIGSSAPIGPANLWIAKAVLPPQKSRQQFWAFVAGVILVDNFYAAIAFWGYFAYLQYFGLDWWMSLGGSSGLILLGLYELWSLRAAPTDESATDEAAALDTTSAWNKDFLMGAFLCGANPAFILFWMFMASVLYEYGVSQLKSWLAGFFFIGVALGDALWYWGFGQVMRKGARYLSQRVILFIRVGVALGFMALGVSALMQFYKGSI